MGEADGQTVSMFSRSLPATLDIHTRSLIIINKGDLVMAKSKSNQEFQTGETVRLISGGPIMTVREIEFGNVYCQWLVGKKLEYGNFPPNSLVRASVDETEK